MISKTESSEVVLKRALVQRVSEGLLTCRIDDAVRLLMTPERVEECAACGVPRLPQGGTFCLVFGERGVTPLTLISSIIPTPSNGYPHCRQRPSVGNCYYDENYYYACMYYICVSFIHDTYYVLLVIKSPFVIQKSVIIMIHV